MFSHPKSAGNEIRSDDENQESPSNQSTTGYQFLTHRSWSNTHSNRSRILTILRLCCQHNISKFTLALKNSKIQAEGRMEQFSFKWWVDARSLLPNPPSLLELIGLLQLG